MVPDMAGSGSAQGETASANAVAAAARTTLAAGTARISHGLSLEPPHRRFGRFATAQEGVTDLARRRTRTDREAPEMLQAWARRLTARWPWLGEEDEDERAARTTTVYWGRACLVDLGAGRWMAADNGHGALDPLGIVDALAYAEAVDARGDATLRGVACRRWSFRADPPTGVEPSGVAGEAWIDHDGRLRRVTWTYRSPRRPRGAGRHRLWTTTELWDFGIPVEIAPPPVVVPDRGTSFPTAFKELAHTLRERKRAYERRHARA
jgi:hypothetical protein